MFTSTARISAIGTYVPEQIITNDQLEQMVETNDEWIVQRTGIRERRQSAPEQFTSDLCIQAVKNLMAHYEGTLEDVDLIIVATTTSDYAFPSVACRIQEAFDIPDCGAFDLNATCAGFTYGLHLANGLITSGLHRKILVVAGETLTKVTDYTDRTTCILFGDGAGAVIVEHDATRPGFLSSVVGSDGSGGRHVYRTGLRDEMDGNPLEGNKGSIIQNGREVYKWAVRTVPAGINKLLEQANLTLESIDWFVPHSANLKMIASIGEKAGIAEQQILHSAEMLGNTSAASIPLALHLAKQDGRLRYGDTLLLYGFGGGLTHAGLIVKWGVRNH